MSNRLLFSRDFVYLSYIHVYTLGDFTIEESFHNLTVGAISGRDFLSRAKFRSYE